MGDSTHALPLASFLGVVLSASDFSFLHPSSCLLCKKPLPHSQVHEPFGARMHSPLHTLVDDLSNLNLISLEEFSPVSSSSHHLSNFDPVSLGSMEEQLRLIRAENAEMKRTMIRMYTMLQSISTEIRNNNNFMNGRISTIYDTVYYVAIVYSKTEDNYRSILEVKGKVDNLGEDIGSCIPSFHDSKGSGIGPEQSLESTPGPDAQRRR